MAKKEKKHEEQALEAAAMAVGMEGVAVALSDAEDETEE